MGFSKGIFFQYTEVVIRKQKKIEVHLYRKRHKYEWSQKDCIFWMMMMIITITITKMFSTVIQTEHLATIPALRHLTLSIYRGIDQIYGVGNFGKLS